METVFNEHSNSGGTYKITNKTNGKVYYGSCRTFKKRQYQHTRDLRKGKHGNKHLQSAWNLDGSDSFVFEVIEVVEGTKQDRLNAEQLLLDMHWDNCQNCYNIERNAWSRDGCKSKNPSPMKGRIPWNKGKKTGHTPWNKGLIGVFSEDALNKIKEARAKQVFPPEVNAKRVAGRVGVPRSEDTKQKIGQANSANMKALWQDELYRNHQSKALKGWNHTTESIEKIANAQKGRKRSPETIEKIREAKRIQWQNPEYRQRMSEAHKKRKRAI